MQRVQPDAQHRLRHAVVDRDLAVADPHIGVVEGVDRDRDEGDQQHHGRHDDHARAPQRGRAGGASRRLRRGRLLDVIAPCRRQHGVVGAFAAVRVSVLVDVQDDHGGVVDPAGFVRRLHQRACCLRRRAGSADLLDRLVLQQGVEAVAAQQDAVAVLHGEDLFVDVHAGVDPERPGQHVALGVIAGFGLADPASSQELADHRVIVGEHAELIPADQVGTGVADVRQVQSIVIDDRGGCRGPHAAKRRVQVLAFVDRQVRFPQGGSQRVRAVAVQMFGHRLDGQG